MKRSTLAAAFVVTALVVNAPPVIVMYPCPLTPRAPQPCVTGEVTSDSAACADVQLWTSSKPNSRSSDGAAAQAEVAVVAGVPLAAAATVTGSEEPPGPR